MVKIGHVIPDFELEAYQNDEIKTLRLSQFRGQWLICSSTRRTLRSSAQRSWRRWPTSTRSSAS